ncbi:MAG TPA: ABC transporter substrate-binding protein [Rubricoccaceae bacterium]|nr:ABC transporter substrate-binding protein [Rubricoccaceae bacterium]
MRVPLLGALALAALLVSTAGCGGRDGGAAEGIVTLTFWHSFVAASQPALEALIARFEAEHPGIRVRAQYLPSGDDLVQKLIASLRTGTAPDVSWVHGDFLGPLAGAGALYPMRHFIDGPDGLSEAELADVFPPLLQAASWRDTLYALPMEATTLALLYNRDRFRAAGLDPDRPPQTWAELRTATRALTADEDGDGRLDRYGFYVPVFPASGPYNVWLVMQWSPYLWMAGGSLVDSTGAAGYAGEAGVQALTLWRDLYEDMGRPHYSFGHDGCFVAQACAMIMDGPWDLPRFRDLGFDWGVAPLPAGPAGPATYLDGEHLAIFRQTEHPDAAWAFVKWMLRPDVQASFSMASGYLPVRRSVLDLPEYRAHLAGDPGLAAFVAQIPLGRAREPMDAHQVAINRHVAEAVERALVGREDPRAALTASAAETDRLLGEGR